MLGFGWGEGDVCDDGEVIGDGVTEMFVLLELEGGRDEDPVEPSVEKGEALELGMGRLVAAKFHRMGEALELVVSLCPFCIKVTDDDGGLASFCEVFLEFLKLFFAHGGSWWVEVQREDVDGSFVSPLHLE